MLSPKDNKFLTQVGPKTPVGELFRRFWIPALLSEELPGPDCEPVRLRLLGEDLLAFKDTNGRAAIVDAYCPHRSAPLFFGRNEECGLRCVYHGWKFDVDGNCVEMPNCTEGESFKERVKLTSYPVADKAGMIWVFMGPSENVPQLPGFDWLDVPSDQRYVFKYVMDCNYLQTLENEFDTTHSSFLHSTLDGNVNNPINRIAGQSFVNRRRMLDYSRITIVDTDCGSAMVTRQDPTADGKDVYTLGIPYWMPSFSAAGALSAPGVFPINMKVPVDDTHSVFFRFKWSREPLSEKVLHEMKYGNYEFPVVIPGTYRAQANQSNDYQIDRVRQRFFNYSGIVNTPVQDFAMVENQRGPVTDRARETLVSSDKYLIHIRRRIMTAAQKLEQGEEPREPWHPEAYRLRTRRIEVPSGTPLEQVTAALLDLDPDWEGKVLRAFEPQPEQAAAALPALV
jgi:phenylpropionate dioxygenase-like ring-hydroxylating dioxygenase large terminal subunit